MRPGNPGMYLIFAMTVSRPGKYLKMKESPGKLLEKLNSLTKPLYFQKLPTLIMLFVQFGKLFQAFFSEI